MHRTNLCKASAVAVFLVWSLSAGSACAQEAPRAEASENRFNIHFQLTTVTQAHPAFDAAYSGQNSLVPASEHETTVTSTLYLGARLWKGAELYANPELSGGSGLSKTFGIAGFSNGEAFRVGNPQPHIYLARLVLRQTFALGAETEAVEDEANQLGGRRPVCRFTISLGRFGVTDYFDDNIYSHEPRSQFLNWAGWTSGAWDYPADTRGYTWGFVVEYDDAAWALRFAAAAEPRVANGLEFDKDLLHAHSFMGELERGYTVGGEKGMARVALFYNRAQMGNYREAIEGAQGQAPDITATRQPGRTKWGFVVNLEQSLSVGAVRREPLPHRGKDEAGLAFIANAMSRDHRDYLAAGGFGFMIGDGRLDYGLEKIAELYYKAALHDHIWLTVDYQFVQNPAYNRDRGPAHVFGLRLHSDF